MKRRGNIHDVVSKGSEFENMYACKYIYIYDVIGAAMLSSTYVHVIAVTLSVILLVTLITITANLANK